MSIVWLLSLSLLVAKIYEQHEQLHNCVSVSNERYKGTLLWLIKVWKKNFPEWTMSIQSCRNAASVPMHHLRPAIWRHIWRHTVEKSQTNVTNVIIHPLSQAIWADIWKNTVGKSWTNATSVTTNPLAQVIWADIWKFTVEISLMNATSVNILHLRQVI